MMTVSMFAQVLEMLGWEKNKHFYCGFRTIGSQDYYYAKVIQQKFDSTLLFHYRIITLTLIYSFYF